MVTYLAYTAGAFRDCTRIANISPGLWSQLFIENKTHLLEELDNFMDALNKFRDAIESDNKEALFSLLSTVKKNKLTMLAKELENN